MEPIDENTVTSNNENQEQATPNIDTNTQESSPSDSFPPAEEEALSSEEKQSEAVANEDSDTKILGEDTPNDPQEAQRQNIESAKSDAIANHQAHQAQQPVQEYQRPAQHDV